VLRWTAPGGDGREGTAAAYDLRHALTPIESESWDSATVVTGLSVPKTAGSTETFSVTGLVRSESYFFALESIDKSEQRSGLSNVVSARTRSLLRLTSSPHPSGAYDPDWSPDGERIAFIADWQQRFHGQVYVMTSSGGGTRRLTNVEEGARAPRWSPDGSRLAFGSRHAVGSQTVEDIAIVNPDGGGDATVIATLGNSVTISALSWSPDGTVIACALRDLLVLGPQIYLVEASGGTPELLGGGAGAIGLDWSPDGSRIVFASIENQDYGIWVLPATGGVPMRLTTSSTVEFAPSWSPDGERIAFTSSRGGTQQLWVMSTTGENLMRLTAETGDELSQTWSPDGDRIAFNRVSNQIFDIWVLYLDPAVASNRGRSGTQAVR